MHFSPAFNFADAIQWIRIRPALVNGLLSKRQITLARNQRAQEILDQPSLSVEVLYDSRRLRTRPDFDFGGLQLYVLKCCNLNEFRQATDSSGRGPNVFVFMVSFRVVTFGIVSATFCVLLFVIGMVLSHRTVGPLHAFESFLNDHIEGKRHEIEVARRRRIQAVGNPRQPHGRSELNPKSSRSKSG